MSTPSAFVWAVLVAPASQPEAPPQEEKSGWERLTERLKVAGDFRLRAEFNWDRDSAPDQSRVRIRGRIGATYAVHDDLSLGVRLVTNESAVQDPRSTHVTLGRAGDEGFRTIRARFDRVYARYVPGWANARLWMEAGKFGHAFRGNPIYKELVWDDDVQPEGFAAGYKFPLGVGVLDSLHVLSGYYIGVGSDLRAGDAGLWLAQGTLDLKWSDTTTSFVSAGWYDWLHVDRVGRNFGNATRPGGRFASQFKILHAVAGHTFPAWERPLTFAGEYWKNFGDRIGESAGWSIGLAYGKLKDPWDWRIYAQWRRVHQDSVYSVVAQDDAILTTNFDGPLAGFTLMVMKDVDVHLRIMGTGRIRRGTTPTTDSRIRQMRFQIEVNIKF